jgi:ectoine hydroxylase-related dioxygenase (phytanoyl-CoA dioxygenase family)
VDFADEDSVVLQLKIHPLFMTALEQNGFELVTRLWEAIRGVRAADFMEAITGHAITGRAGTRNLLTESAAVRHVADEIARLEVVGAATGQPAFPVRALFFDKTPETNWNVSWHQDLSIAVAERYDAPGFTGWALKEGVWHVQPPAEILERMITVRLHLDDCESDSGPLRVIPGSHREGRLDRDAIERWRTAVPAYEIICAAGDVLLMRPLLLHASSKATRPLRRRVLHIEFAGDELPGDLNWEAGATRPPRPSAPVRVAGRS